MHSFWSGSISFGLVNIPVHVFSAAEERELRFHYLHKKDMSPVRYAKICKKENEEVAFKDLVRGYEFKKGAYVVMSDRDFKNAAPEKTKAIAIEHFVDEGEIDLMYSEHPYYLKPDKRAEKPYALLRHALNKSKKVAVARYVFRTKENIGVIKPVGEVLVLNQLRFHDEIRSPGELKIPKRVPLSAQEIKMAVSLVNQLTEPFDVEKYEDTYSEDLLAAIKRKVKGKEIEGPEEKESAPAKVYDLMDALRKSLDKKGNRSGSKVSSHRSRRSAS